MSEESEEGVTVLRKETQQGEAPRVRAAKSSEFCQRENCEHLRWTHLEHLLHCTDLSARLHCQRTLSKERWGQGLDERYRSSREEEEQGDEDGQEKGRRRKKEKTGDRF